MATKIFPSVNDIAPTQGDGKTLKESNLSNWAGRVSYAADLIISGLSASAGTGLNLNISSGNAFIDGRWVNKNAQESVTLTDNTTNHVFLKLTKDGSGNVTGASLEANTTGIAPADSIKICEAATSGGSVSSVTDKRNISVSIAKTPSGSIVAIDESGAQSDLARLAANETVIGQWRFNNNIGIGMTPLYPLDITTSGAGAPIARFVNTNANGNGILIRNGNDNNYSLNIFNAAGTASNIQLFGSGNAFFNGKVGIGTSPSAKFQVGDWFSVPNALSDAPISATGAKRVDLGRNLHLISDDPTIGFNAYWNGTSWIYSTTDSAFLLNHDQNADRLTFRTAASGTAGGAVSFSTPLAINTSGQLISNIAIGTSPFSITSTTVNTNLNADMIDDMHAGASVTGYSRGITIQINNTTGTAPGGFNLQANIGASWETVGATGAGAMNTWTALDSVPQTAVAVILKFDVGNPNVSVYCHAKRGGSALTVGDYTRMISVPANGYGVVVQIVPITGSSRIFELYMENAVTTGIVTVNLMGWIE